MRHSLFLLFLTTWCAALFAAEPAPAVPATKAFVAESYEFYRSEGEGIKSKSITQTTLIVIFEEWIAQEHLQKNTMVELQSDTGPISDIRFIQGSGGGGEDADKKQYWKMAIFSVPPTTARLKSAVVRYSTASPVDLTEKTETTGDDRKAVMVKTDRPIPDCTVNITMIEAGKAVDKTGKIFAIASVTPVASNAADTFEYLWRNGSLLIEPQIADSADEIGLAYGLQVKIDDGEIPNGFVRLDLQAEGRVTSDDESDTLQGYSQGGVSAKGMILAGQQQAYPLGIRISGGYESDERFDRFYWNATAQAVVTVPYISKIPLLWHSMIGLDRLVAPPFVAGGVVYSKTDDSEVVEDDLSRVELEAGWNVPVSQKVDFQFRYQYFMYFDDDVEDHHFGYARALYYLDDQRNTSVTVSLEDGARAVLDEIGPAVLVGFMIKAF